MSRKSYRREQQVYKEEDADRAAFIEANAVSLVREKDALIRRQQEHIAKLERANSDLRQRNRVLQANLDLGRIKR